MLSGGLTVACSGDDQAPSRLMDGSRVRALSVELEGISAPPVLTRARLVPAGGVGADSMSASCLRRNRGGAEASGRIVERIGVVSESVTFRDRSGDGLHACDNTTGPREDDRRWCGVAFGHLYSGHLRDPRLDLACATEDRNVVGFVWVEPGEDTRYLVVGQPAYAEVYEVSGDLPVRVATTSGVEVEGSRAAVVLSEHDGGGRLLLRYVLEAAVAG